MFVASSRPTSPLSGWSEWGSRLYTPCSACFHHTLKLLYCLNTSSTPPGKQKSYHSCCINKVVIWIFLVRVCRFSSHLATHTATGSAVMPSSRKCVKGLLAFHANSHLVVPDPARRTAAEFLCLEKCLHLNMKILKYYQISWMHLKKLKVLLKIWCHLHSLLSWAPLKPIWKFHFSAETHQLRPELPERKNVNNLKTMQMNLIIRI